MVDRLHLPESGASATCYACVFRRQRETKMQKLLGWFGLSVAAELPNEKIVMFRPTSARWI